MPVSVQQRQLRASNAAAAFSSKRAGLNRHTRRPSLVVHAGLFNFLSQPSAAKTSNRAAELVDELFALTRNTNAGASMSAKQRDAVRELIEELQQFCPRNPLRNKLLFGNYEVLYSFKVDATGGSLRSGTGPILFPGQKPSQILEEPNTIINRLDFKTLGFLPGYGQQTGTFRSLNADTFELSLTQRQVNIGLGSEQVADIDFVRKIQILYLDERCRVARFIPEADSVDSEFQDNAFFVFRRVVEEEEKKPAPAPIVQKQAGQKQAAQKQEAAAKGTALVPLFGGGGKQPGLATLAERKVRQQLEEDAAQSNKGRGTGIVRTRPGTGVVKARAAPGTGVVGRKQAAPGSGVAAKKAVTVKGVDPRAAAAEKKRAEAEAAKARQREEAERAKARQREEAERAQAKQREEAERAKAKQREAEERAKREEAARLAKERVEAERQAKAQRLAAVKEALNKLGAELQAAQIASRTAKVDLRNTEKETQDVTKQTAVARAQLEAAIARTEAASNELQAAVEGRNKAQSAARDAQAALKEAEKTYREQTALISRR